MKSPEMQKFLDSFSQQAFGREYDGDVCPTCGSDAINPEDFRDEISRREYGISRMCQACQDSVFGI